MRFLVGVVFGILLVVFGAAAVVVTGSFNTAATIRPGRLEKRIAGFALDRSVAKRASDRKNPHAPTPDVLREGLEEYRENCLVCHGAPGVDAGPIGAGLNPAPPDLTVPSVQARSDGELFWLTAQGIRLTGMPAFAPTHSEDELWKVVAFLRHLPELTEAEEQELARRESHAEESGSSSPLPPSPAAPEGPPKP